MPVAVIISTRPLRRPSCRNAGILGDLLIDLGPQPDINYASTDRAGIAPLRMKRPSPFPPAELETLRKIVGTLGDDKRSAARSAVGYDAGERPELEVFGTPVMSGDEIGRPLVGR